MARKKATPANAGFATIEVAVRNGIGIVDAEPARRAQRVQRDADRRTDGGAAARWAPTTGVRVDRADRQRCELLRGRGSQLDEEDGGATAARRTWPTREALARMLRTLNDVPKPTVARIHGAAYGGGVGLVACCDIAIAAAEATFALSEAKLGLIPATISPYVIDAIGARQARRYFLTAERFEAAEAYRLGLVHDIVPIAQLDDRDQRSPGSAARRGPARAARVQGADPRGRAPAHRRQARRRHRAPHRDGARVAGRQGGRGGIPRQARPRVDSRRTCASRDDAALRAFRHLAARGARRRGRLGERPAACTRCCSSSAASATSHWIELPAGLDVLTHPLVLAASGFMCFVEFFADKIPGVDSAWDLVQTFIRIPAGAALAASVFGDSSDARDARRGDPRRHARRRQPSREDRAAAR